MKKLSIFCIALLLAFSVSYAGVVDVRFANAELDGGSYCVTAQIKAQDIDFEIGSSTLFFSYNPAAINNPVHQPINFSESVQCGITDAAVYQTSFNKLEMNGKGEGNYAIILDFNNQGCPTITSDWIDVANFCFDVVDADNEVKLDIVNKYTAFNTVDNLGDQHALGNVEGVGGSATNIELVTNANDFSIRVLPNKTKMTVNLEYDLQQVADVRITVYDMMGKIVVVKDQAADAPGKQTALLNLGSFGNGYYLVEVDNGKEKASQKVLLAR